MLKRLDERFVDAHDLSVKIMQSYANFTVGGSLSVNVHGRYTGLGPLILSVRSIRLVLANGDLSGSWPIHMRESGALSGVGPERLVSIDQRPNLWLGETSEARQHGAAIRFRGSTRWTRWTRWTPESAGRSRHAA